MIGVLSCLVYLMDGGVWDGIPKLVVPCLLVPCCVHFWSYAKDSQSSLYPPALFKYVHCVLPCASCRSLLVTALYHDSFILVVHFSRRLAAAKFFSESGSSVIFTDNRDLTCPELLRPINGLVQVVARGQGVRGGHACNDKNVQTAASLPRPLF